MPLFRAADFRICNLECVISDLGQPWRGKYFHFRSDAKNVEVLKAAGIDCVSVANNHTLDFEYEAMLEEFKILDQAGVCRAGGGENWQQASQPALARAGDLRIALLAFTDNEPGWAAAEDKPGLLYVPVNLADRRAQEFLRLVREARAEADVLVVSAHWGPNWGYDPPEQHKVFGRALVDAGAEIVFGHSAHVFRGMEVYNDRAILYSTGNFIDDYAVDEVERNDQSFVFVVEVEQGRTRRLELYPTVIRNFQARRASGFEAGEIAKKMQRLCAALDAKASWRAEKGVLEIRVSG